jgi:hypothetical protein
MLRCALEHDSATSDLNRYENSPRPFVQGCFKCQTSERPVTGRGVVTVSMTAGVSLLHQSGTLREAVPFRRPYRLRW